MSDLQTAAKIALEQLKINRTNFRKGPSKSICKMLAGGNDEAIAKLEAALENEFNPDWDRVEALEESNEISR